MIDNTQVMPQDDTAEVTDTPLAPTAAQQTPDSPREESTQEAETERPRPWPTPPAEQEETNTTPDTGSEWPDMEPETPAETLAETQDSMQSAEAQENTTAPDTPAPATLETRIATPDSGANEAKESYWKRVLTGNPATVPTDIRALAGADDDELDAEEQNYRLLGTINRSWAADHLGTNKEEVQDGWKDCRSQLAQSLGVADNEQEVFMGLSAREEDKPRREIGKRIYERAYLAGLQGEESYDIRSLQTVLDENDREAAESLGLEAFDQGVETRNKWLPLAEQVARGVDVFSGIEEDFMSAPRIFSAAPDLLRAVDEVADLTDEDRETVLFLAAHQAKLNRPGEKEGLGSRLVRAVRRGATNIGMGVGQLVNHTGVAMLSGLGKQWGGDTGEAMQKTADAWERRTQMLARLRELTQQEIAPLYPAEAASRAESYLINAAEATPAAVLSFCGGAGFAALAASGMGDSVAAARSLNPQGDREMQLAAGIIGGAVQGAIYMGMGRLGGRLLEQSIANFMKSRGAGIGTFSMNSLKSAGAAAMHGTELIAAGKLAQATEMGAQELAARLSGTASHIDWRGFGDNLADIETNMREAASILPFLLIGSGRVALRHFRSPRAVLGEGLALRDWGIDDTTRTEILQAPDIDTQGTKLREALRNSRRWSAPGFMPDIVRAMHLFNGDYFKGFRDIDCVRDFLKLPSERSLIENKVVRERDATTPEVLDLEGHANSRDLKNSIKKKTKFAETMQFWDAMYQRSHIAEHTPRYYFGLMPEGMESAGDDRVDFYRDITRGVIPTIPYRMRNVGYYNPRGEAERRALVRDRAQECIDLSYQFVMSTYTVDSLMAHPFPMSRIATHLEITRNNVIGQMACAVLDMAMGMKPKASMRKLAKYLAWHCVRRRYRGASPEWMRETSARDMQHMNDYIQDYSSVTDMHRQDFRNVLRVISGLNACARTLVRVLPMTSDFQTALTRGMSPLQAYHHLLVRELGFNPDKVSGYPKQAIEKSANNSDLKRFTEENDQVFQIAHSLSGTDLEQCTGEDGLTYWRAQRPDSGFTRWHTERKDAINELAISMSPYFGKLGLGIHPWLYQAGSKDHFDLQDAPRATYQNFSGFDQLCSIALRDLGNFWQRSVTRTQPGFQPTRIRTMLTGRIAKSLLQMQDQSKQGGEIGKPGADVSLDRMGLLTPAGMIRGRFRVFWERAFNSGLLTVPEAGDFLIERGYLTPERYQKIFDLSKQLPYPKNPHIPLRLTPPPDIVGMHREMAKEMSKFHSLYYFAHVQDQNLPESVKTWFRMVPYCPDMPEEDNASSHRVNSHKNDNIYLSWANRNTAMLLKQLAPEIEAMRRQVGENPLPQGRISDLILHATGESEPQRYEQSWCYHYCGPGVFRGTPQKDWELMLEPMRTWEIMSDEEKQDMRSRLESFCREDPSQDALDAAGRGENVDYLEHSLQQLDRVLKRFPDLHRFAPATESPYAIRVLQLNDAPPQHDLDAEPETAPVSLRWIDDFDAAYAIERMRHVPEVLQNDEEALSSLRFLDTLRRISIRRPYAMANGIWWDKQLYGGQFGLHPKGLEDWQVEEPLEPLFQLLNNIHSLCKDAETDSISICGVKLQGAPWKKQDFDELANTSIYRWPKNRARAYRLMPGYPDSPNVRVRSPYVVACHRGTYMKGDLVIRKTEDLQHSFCPLEQFRPNRLRYPNEMHLKLWRNVALDSILDSVVDRTTYLEATNNGESGVVGLGELLLRLCEDTGFCHTLNPNTPHELTPYQAHIVNVATAMLSCMQQDRSEQSMNRLRAAVLPIQKDAKLRHYVLQTLRDSCDKTGDNTALHNNLMQELDLNWNEVEEAHNGEQTPPAAPPQLNQGELFYEN